jgi:ribosomal-protein-alanine acetyltransferase
MAAVTVRRATEADLAAVARIQSQSAEAADWDPGDYRQHDFTVALCADRVAGFLVARNVADGESEILNLAVDPGYRRRGIGRALLCDLLSRHPGAFFLEVRESNRDARKFYESLGFQMISVRPGYYEAPPESAIVMKFHSC